MMIHPGQSLIVPTGLNVNIPEGYEIQVRPRSGLAAKNCITVLNSPGTIDCDFFGLEEKFELKVILINHGKMPFVINHNDRIAQLVICQLPNIEFKVVEEFSENSNDNRTGGFGSTGV
jgi:dUTP pyrophosphatase